MAVEKSLEAADSAGNINIDPLVNASLWSGTLAGFREKASGTDPVPASVAISAVTASLAIALLAKVLAIAGKSKRFIYSARPGDRQRIGVLLDAAREESARLTHLADEDIAAFNQYMDCKRQGRELTAAIHKAIEVPMDAARSVVRGLGLCAEAAGMIQGLTAADIGAAGTLLFGAVQAMLLSVDFNIREMSSDERFSSAITAERRELSIEARRSAEAVTAAVNALLG
jgi:formiminotetrahydrofolate cyclodeaminase